MEYNNPADETIDITVLRVTAAREISCISISLWAENLLALSDLVYIYYFNRAIPWPEQLEMGAFHSGEIPYVFNNSGLLDRSWEHIDHTLSEQVYSYWIDFAKNGNSTGDGLEEWPPLDGSEDVMIQLGGK